jgi:amino acid permease
LFRNRKTQLLVNRLAITANIIGLVLAVVLFMNDGPNMQENITPDDGVGAYLPFAFLVFAFLANHFINKDEKLVQSMDRLR